METLSKIKRTISGETMSDVLKFVPKDGFKLSDALLNKEYVCTNVDEYDVNDSIKSFAATYENSDGDIIVLSASAIKRARVINKKVAVQPDELFKNNKNIGVRSKCTQVWSNSQFGHAAFKMRKGDDFEVPAKIILRYAILFEDKKTGNPLFSPYMYEGFSNVVKAYSEAKKGYPNMDAFRMELLKEGKDRLSFLPSTMTEPTLYEWVKEDVSEFRHTLVIEKV